MYFPCSPRIRHIGDDEQTFGVNQQVPHARGRYKSGDGSVAQLPGCEPRPPGLTLPSFTAPWPRVARTREAKALS